MWDCRPGRWFLPGFVTVLLLTLVAMILRADLIEGDLTNRALQNLATEHSWAKVVLDGRDLTLSGTAPSAQAKSSALRLADGVFGDSATGTWGVRVVNGAGIADLPVQSPYVTGGALSAEGITLSGFVPSDTVRAEIAMKAATTFPNARITDAMQLADGAPSGLVSAAAFAGDQMKRFSSGSFRLSDGALTISGIAASDADYDAVSAALSGKLPEGMTLASANIMPPKVAPYPFAANRAGSVVTLTGRVPSNVVRQGLIDRAKGLFPGASVNDQLKLASGEAAAFADQAGFAIDQLKPLDEAEAALVDATLSLKGKASAADIAASVRAALSAALPFGLGLGELAIVAPEPAQVAAQVATPVPAPVAAPEPAQVATPEPAPAAPPVVAVEAPTPPPAVEPAAPAPVTPYVFSAVKTGNTVILTGSLPSEELKKSLLTRAKKPGLEIVSDKAAVAPGAPEGFDAAAAGAVDFLSFFSDGSVLISDRKVAIDGTARDTGAYDAAIAGVAGASPSFDGGLSIISANIDRPFIQPYVWTARRLGTVITLTGYAPDSQTRDSGVASQKASAPDATVIDRVEIADGKPAKLSWGEATDFGAAIAGKLKKGVVKLTDDVFSVNGEASTPESYDDALKMIATAMPANLVKGTVVIRRPTVAPFTMTARRDGDIVALSGFAPDAKTADSIADWAKRRFGTALGDVSIKLAAGAPVGFDGAVNAALLALSRLNQGSFTISDTTGTLTGEVPFGAPLEEIRDRFEGGMPPGFLATATLTQAPKPAEVAAETCATQILDSASKNRVFFASAKATILSDSFGLLDGIAASALSCPVARFEIIGHTDSDGSEESNIRLSNARAEAVADYLVKAGVARDRLETLGLGESQPVVDNATPENKAQNRRIEFRLIKSQ